MSAFLEPGIGNLAGEAAEFQPKNPRLAQRKMHVFQPDGGQVFWRTFGDADEGLKHFLTMPLHALQNGRNQPFPALL